MAKRSEDYWAQDQGCLGLYNDFLHGLCEQTKVKVMLKKDPERE